jgi:hypothetical protein
MSSATPLNLNKTQSAGKTQVPPEEQFWQRYSPHYEFPLSTVTSIVLHILAFVLLALIAWYIAKMASEQSKPLPEIGVVVVGGGGGNPKGVGGGPGGELKAPPEQEDVGKHQEDVVPPEDPKHDPTLKPSAPIPPVLPTVTDDDVRNLIKSGNDAVRALPRINQENQEKLRRGLIPTGEGKDGPGAGGGKDRGRDTGTGRDQGPGTGDVNERLKRTLRWVMVFDTYNGDDYANQLAGLGAILAIPQGGGKNVSYMVIHDLTNRPARGRVEDIEQIKRIYWIDEKRESITPLCIALGIKPVPDHVVAFFPEKLEKLLLKIELQYKNKKEHEIYETRFKVVKRGGTYVPEVSGQKFN